MTWSEMARQGFALAAAVADDPGGKLAAEGLAPAVADALCLVSRELALLAPEERRQRVTRIAALLNPRPPRTAALDPRALALLAAEVDAETGRRWLRQSPPPRPGYAPDPGLRALVRLIALRSEARGTGASGGSDAGRKG
jgi:hypothetical protein